MIKFTGKVRYTLVFDFAVKGQVKEADLMGALLTLTSNVHPDYNITKLQNNQKIGKLVVHINSEEKDETTRGTLEVTSNDEPLDCSIFCSVLETINKVGLFPSIFKLKEVVHSEKVNYQKLLKRALEINKLWFGSQGYGAEAIDLKKTLLELTSSSKAITLGPFTLGSSFYESTSILVVEGRKDVLTLNECGLQNTFALGGFDYDLEKVSQLLKDKELTLFLDGDRGGKQIEKKILTHLTPKYLVKTPENFSVENLKKAQIFDLIKSRTLFQ